MQLILNRKNGSDEVLAVLEDGALPGHKIIGHTDKRRWNSQPIGDWWIIHVPGEPASAFAHLLEPEREEVEPGEFRQVNRRKNHLNLTSLTAMELGDLAAQRTIVLSKIKITSRKRNA